MATKKKQNTKQISAISMIFSSVQLLSHVRLFATHGLQHTRLPCPSPIPGACSISCPSSQWCHPTISSSVIPFSCLQPFPSIRVYPNESVLCIRWPKYWSFSFNISPSNEYSGLISLRINSLISSKSKGLLRVFPSTTVQKHQFLALSFLHGPTLTSIHDYWKIHSFD